MDPRAPDCTGGTKKVADHGGFAHDDTTAMMFPVEIAQIAPTTLKVLGLDPHALIAVQKGGAQVLPGLHLGGDRDRFQHIAE